MTVGAGICVAERKLNVLGKSILTDVHENIIVTQPTGEAFTNGAFLGVDSDRIGSHRVFPIGKLQYVFLLLIAFLCLILVFEFFLMYLRVF